LLFSYCKASLPRPAAQNYASRKRLEAITVAKKILLEKYFLPIIFSAFRRRFVHSYTVKKTINKVTKSPASRQSSNAYKSYQFQWFFNIYTDEVELNVGQ